LIFRLSGEQPNAPFQWRPVQMLPKNNPTPNTTSRANLPQFYTDLAGKTSPKLALLQKEPGLGRPLQTAC
jgi:hypothetical protein